MLIASLYPSLPPCFLVSNNWCVYVSALLRLSLKDVCVRYFWHWWVNHCSVIHRVELFLRNNSNFLSLRTLSVGAEDNFSQNPDPCVCVFLLSLAVWLTARGRKKTCSLIYPEAVNLFLPRDIKRHNKQQNTSHSVTPATLLVEWTNPRWHFDLSSFLFSSSPMPPPSLP